MCLIEASSPLNAGELLGILTGTQSTCNDGGRLGLVHSYRDAQLCIQDIVLPRGAGWADKTPSQHSVHCH